jgi:hypothetical protein
MVTLTNNVNAQNIVNRFNDYVQAAGNAGISWGTDAYPFTEMPNIFGGKADTGKNSEINGDSLGGVGSLIVASTIYRILVAETNRYTKIRKLRALLFVEGGGGNTGSRPTPGYVYDSTAVAFLNDGYLQDIGSPSAGLVDSGQTISTTPLETFFDTLRSSYNTARDQTVTYQVNVCHASCHSSCHGSRSRR